MTGSISWADQASASPPVLRTVTVSAGDAVATLLPELQRVLGGAGPPFIPVPDGDDGGLATALRVGEPIGDDADRIALVIPTSGTTGRPKGTLLTAAALTAAAKATHERLGGPGSWLLALPAHHIAGVQVLARSLVAGTQPVELDVSAGFDAAALPGAVARMGPGRRYTSLVAVQLAKALADPDCAAALAELDAVLIGGGPAPAPILEAAHNAGVRVVRTYGMSETAGGCVYDGLPLDGVRLRLRDDGRVLIGGATLAIGYRNPVIPDPFAEPGWFCTDDIGRFDDGRLTVLGRADDAISTGGLTVLPDQVETVLRGHPAVADCAVFGLADDRLGQRVAAAVVLTAAATAAPTAGELRDHVVAAGLSATAAPREVHTVKALPRRGIGKLDRRLLAERIQGSSNGS